MVNAASEHHAIRVELQFSDITFASALRESFPRDNSKTYLANNKHSDFR